MSKEEEQGTELLNVNENENAEANKEDEKKPQKPTCTALVLMGLFLIVIALLGGYYTYYQYNRMEAINNAKKE